MTDFLQQIGKLQAGDGMCPSPQKRCWKRLL